MAVQNTLGPTLGALASLIPDLAANAVAIEAEQIFQVSQKLVPIGAAKKGVPVDTHPLQQSGQVSEPMRDGTRVTVSITYGGDSAPYAVFVHEGHRIVAWGHDTGRMQPPTKFLEQPLFDAKDGMEERLAQTIQVDLTGLLS